MKEIIFTTRRIEAKGEAPAVPTQIITARTENRVDKKGNPREGDWWRFDLSLASIGSPVPLMPIHVAPAKGLDVKQTLREVAEDLLLPTPREAIESDEHIALS